LPLELKKTMKFAHIFSPRHMLKRTIEACDGPENVMEFLMQLDHLRFRRRMEGSRDDRISFLSILVS